MRRFTCIRHGQTDWNVEGRLQGSIDIPLNDTGEDQARAAQAAFKASNTTMAIVSPKQRCLQTLAILQQAHDVPHIVEMALVERSFGDYEGQIRADITAHHCGALPDLDGVEPWEDVKTRAKTTVLAHLDRYPEEQLCFVSHGGFISALAEALKQEKGPNLTNCTMITFEETADGWRTYIPSNPDKRPTTPKNQAKNIQNKGLSR